MVNLKEERLHARSANDYDLYYDHWWILLDGQCLKVSIDGDIDYYSRYNDRCCVLNSNVGVS